MAGSRMTNTGAQRALAVEKKRLEREPKRTGRAHMVWRSMLLSSAMLGDVPWYVILPDSILHHNCLHYVVVHHSMLLTACYGSLLNPDRLQ